MKYKYIFAISLIATVLITLFNAVPVASWSEWEEGKYESFGPRCDRLIFRPYMSPPLEYTGLLADEIDFVDWVADKDWMDDHCDDPDIGCAPYYERGMYQVDLNVNLTYTAFNWYGDPNLDTYTGKVNPTADVWFRRAIAFLVDKDRYVTEVLRGLGGKMITACDPPPPYGPFTEYAGYMYEGPPYYEYDPAQAQAILDAHGWDDKEPDGTRNYPEYLVAGRPNIDTYLGAGVHLVMRSDKPKWMQWSNMLADEMNAVGIPTFRDVQDKFPAILRVLFGLQFHLYFGGWSFGRDPLYMRDLWYSAWTTGVGTLNINYAQFNNATFDYWADRIQYADCIATAQTGAKIAQRVIAEHVPCIPLVYDAGIKGYRETACSGPNAGLAWEGFVNERGYGINTPWTYSNAHPTGVHGGGGGGGGTLVAGMSTDIQDLIPVVAYMYYDHCILDGCLFGALTTYDPYNPTFSGDIPEMASWREELWDATGVMDPSLPGYPMATKLTYYLEPGLKFHDGAPFTTADVEFSIRFNQVLGPEVSWDYASIEHVYDIDIVNDQKVVIYMDSQSIFYKHMVGQYIYVPKHIWEGAYPNWTDPAWDPNVCLAIDVFANPEFLIGNGPWMWNATATVAHEYYVLDAFRDNVGNVVENPFPQRVSGPFPHQPEGVGGEPVKFDHQTIPIGPAEPCNNDYNAMPIFWKTNLAIEGTQLIYVAAVNYDFGSGATVTVSGEYWTGSAWEPLSMSPQIVTLGPCTDPHNPASVKRLKFDLPGSDALGYGDYSYDVRFTMSSPSGTYTTGVYTITFDVTAVGDVNSDCIVDMADKDLISYYFGGDYEAGVIPYDPSVDCNCDCMIDMADMDLMTFHFGDECPP